MGSSTGARAVAARTVPGIGRLQLCAAVIPEGAGRPGVSDLGVSIQVVV